jgi:hypothetical protein
MVDSLLRDRFPSRRPEAIDLDELDQAGVIASLSLLISLRQDALAAAKTPLDPGNVLQISGAVGQLAKDWPLSLVLIWANVKDLRTSSAIQSDPRFLATNHPDVFHTLIERAGAKYNVLPEILYAVIKNESGFSPWALSSRDALGLFQFIPKTFDSLNARWNLLDSLGINSRETFLLNPELNINLGSRHFREELLDLHEDNVFFAIIEHNSGTDAVRDWISLWQKLERIDDIEYMTETIRYGATRIFWRRVFADLILVKASGIFSQDGDE